MSLYCRSHWLRQNHIDEADNGYAVSGCRKSARMRKGDRLLGRGRAAGKNGGNASGNDPFLPTLFWKMYVSIKKAMEMRKCCESWIKQVCRSE